MPYGKEWAECPRCGKRAKDKDEIEEKFGYRDMGDGRHIPQSHCRECRIKELGKGHWLVFFSEREKVMTEKVVNIDADKSHIIKLYAFDYLRVIALFMILYDHLGGFRNPNWILKK